jgi:CubicO group peptidase (beta-lactamase class C family)
MTDNVCNLQAADGFDLRPWVSDETGPGVIAAVLSAGGVVSWSDRGRVTVGGRGGRLTPQTVFYVASVSKQFTAACITACEADGAIAVDASIRRYLPELPALFEPITIRHLLHHLGGLPHGGAAGLTATPKGDGDLREGLGLWDLIGLLAQEPTLLSPPGERYAYSNCGYWLLAAAVERASGEALATYARRRIFDPLGMHESRFRDTPDTPQPGLAPGHVRNGDGYAPVATRFHGVGDGGLLTTVRDLGRWDLFWSGRSTLGPDLPARLLQSGRRNDGAGLAYARGVSVRRHRGVPIISHGGSFTGYQAKLVRFPDQDFSICALANADDIDTDALCIALADRTLPDLADLRAPSWAETFREDGLAI